MQKTNKIFGVITLIVGIMLIFSLIGCDSSTNDDSGYDGWPPSSELAKFQLSGWTQPAGISGITWAHTGNTAALLALQIQFSGATADTADSINNYIQTAGYWFAYGSPISSGPVHYISNSEKAGSPTYDYVVNYNFDVPNGGGIQLIRETIDGSGGGGGGSFTVTGFPGYIPDQTVWMIYASTKSNITNFADLLNAANYTGSGYIASDGLVTWVWPSGAPTAAFTLYIVKQGGALMKTSSTVQITGGNGTVAYSAFNNVP
jgi:hypothetical protein